MHHLKGGWGERWGGGPPGGDWPNILPTERNTSSWLNWDRPNWKVNFMRNDQQSLGKTCDKKCSNVKDESRPRPDKDLEERARGGGRPGFKLLFILQTIQSEAALNKTRVSPELWSRPSASRDLRWGEVLRLRLSPPPTPWSAWRHILFIVVRPKPKSSCQ